MINLSKQQHFKPSVQDLVSEFDIYSFNEATHYHSHLFLGSRVIEYAGLSGVQFTLWAPNLKAVSLSADFNNWSVTANPLKKINNSGLWSLWIPNIKVGAKYQYVIHDTDGQSKFINDPYSEQVDFEKRLCSVVVEDNYNWNDATWIKARENTEFSNKAISILSFDLQDFYSEVYTYQNLAKLFVDEAISYGATHIELNNFMETIKNFNISKNSSETYNEYHYFSPSSCFGAIEDLKCLIDYCHQKSIGVILKIPYFEEENFSIFGNFKNLTKNQHKNFYLSNIVFWLEEYHIDGFNFGSIESLIFKSNHSEVKDFIQSINETIHARSTGVFSFASDPTGFPGLTKPSFMDGLGFNMKSNLTWLNEMKKFFAFDGYDISDFIYSTINIFAENFLLSLGDTEKNWEDLGVIDAKLLLAFYFMLPGKKYISHGFIKSICSKIQEEGNDSFFETVDSSFDPHDLTPSWILAKYLARLNSIYKNSPTLHETDFRESKFEWINYDEQSSQASFIRWSKDYKNFYLVIFNFSDQDIDSFTLGVPQAGYYKKIFSSNSLEFCGSDFEEIDGVYSFHKELDNRPVSITVDLPAESVSIFKLA